MNITIPRLFLTILLLGAVGTISFPAAAADAAADVESATHAFSSMKIKGSLNSSYYFRSNDGDDDNDLYSYLSMQLDDIVEDHMDAAFSLFWHYDLDGETGGNYAYDPFLDIDQSASREFRAYTGYVKLKELGFESSWLRLGRQVLEEIDYAHFDGATYGFSPMEKLEVQFFGGAPVTFYSGSGGDAFYGTNVDYRFSDRLRVAGRYYCYDSDPFQDDVAEIEIWNQVTSWLMTHDKFSLLDGEPYLLEDNVYARFEAIDLDVFFKWLTLFDHVEDHTINFNPYFPLLNGYEPFNYISLYGIKGLSKYLSVSGGVDYRAAEDGTTVEVFNNRDYVRGTVGVEVYPTEQLTISANAEFWRADPDDEFTGFSGEVEYKPNKKWTLAAGAEYGEYVQEYRDEFLLFFGESRVFRISPDVITYYASVKWQPTSRVYTKASFEIEDSDYEDEEWFALRLQAGVTF